MAASIEPLVIEAPEIEHAIIGASGSWRKRAAAYSALNSLVLGEPAPERALGA